MFECIINDNERQANMFECIINNNVNIASMHYGENLNTSTKIPM